MYKEFGISDRLIELSKKVEEEIQDVFKNVNKIAEINSLKVLQAFQKNNLSEVYFGSTTGYGYGDVGRDNIEKIFSDILKSEDALVRTQFISGTHALTVTLFGLLRPGDVFLSINGKPYDTLDSVIGIEENSSSLKSYGIKYEQIDLVDSKFDMEKIKKRVTEGKLKLVTIQRSRGYDLRDSLSLDEISKVVEEIKGINSDVIVMVDNCYGEFVDIIEPIELGADVIVRIINKKFRRRNNSKWCVCCTERKNLLN